MQKHTFSAIFAFTVIVFSGWLVLKTDKSPSDSDIREQGIERHSAAQVSEHPLSATEANNQSGTKDASTASVQAIEMAKAKTANTDNANERTQFVAATEKLPANQVKGPNARPAKIDPRASRRFGKGAPFAIGDLPDGKLKENLLALTPSHKAKALKWLHSFNFSGIDAIDHLRADNTGGIFYTCAGVDAHGNACAHHDHPSTPSTEAAGITEAAEANSAPSVPVVAAAAVPISSPPIYNSKPDAPNHIYLDFNGGVVTGKAWNNNPSYGNIASWDVQAWSQDGDFTTFNDSEQAWMRRVYERVAEDYAPFDVNVTTDTAYDPDATGGLNNVGWLLHCTGTDKNGVNLPHVNSGGVAYVGVFGIGNYASTYQPAWVKSSNGGGSGNASNVAEASSHEMGHNMGLSHDTRSNESYYGGHGSGDISWGPIMGTGYGRNVSQWSKGDYYDSKHASYNGSGYDNYANTNDDLLIISDRVSYRVDDHGDSPGAATAITPAGDGSLSQAGIIERTNDPDYFSFSTGAGSITLNANPYRADMDENGGNLDIVLELYDSGSTLIASSNPATLTSATITTTVLAGNYYIKIKPTGAGNATGTGSPYDSNTSTRVGYTVYGSVGQYTITGNVILPGVSVIEPGGTNVTEGGATDTYSLVLGTKPDFDVTVTITPDLQVTVNKPSVTFTPDNWATAQQVIVTAVDDSNEEGFHTGTIDHTATSGDPNFNGVGVGSIIANITDNDNIVVTSPNGGESFYANTVQAITWDSLLPGNVKIELLRGGSATTIVASTPNNGSYNWSIPQFQAPANDYRIRVTSVETPARTDTADGFFTIIEAPIYFTDLEGTAAPSGFTGTGDWEWGTPSGANAAASAYSGTKMYDTVLADTSWATSTLTSVAINCENYSNVQLQYFLHALLRNDTGTYPGSFTLRVQVSNNNTWVDTSGVCKTVFTQTGMNTSWVQYDYDISDIADGSPAVYIRWTQTNNNQGSYQTTGGGVAVDDIKLTGDYTSPVNTYTVTYNGNTSNGGSAPVDSAQYEDGATVTVLSNAGGFTKTNHQFVRWDTQSDGNGTSYLENDIFTIGAADVTLYAIWTPTYSVIYNGNGSDGGSVPTDSNAYLPGANATILGNTGNLARTGFTFQGWQTSSGGGTTYSPGASVTIGSNNLNLYAKWTAVPTYPVTFYGNTNTGGTPPSQTKTQGIDLVITGSGTLVKTGHDFVSWNTQQDGNGQTYLAGATYSGDAPLSLYAQWTVSTYTISYAGNGQTGGSAPSNQTKIYDTNIVISDQATLVKGGHTFDSWNTNFNGSGTSYAAGTTYSANADLDLYAQWTPNTYIVSYNGNGGTGSAPPNQMKTHGVNLTLASDEGSLVRTGLTFSGWNTASDGTGAAYEVGGTYIANTAVTLYAQWSLTADVLEEGFETPDTASYNEGLLPNTSNWVRADDGSNGTKEHLHGITDKSTGDFASDDPDNDQAYLFKGINSGITTAQGEIGVLTDKATYTVTFDAMPYVDNPQANKIYTNYKAQLIAFAPAAARNDCSSTPAGSLLLKEISGAVEGEGISFSYTTGDIADAGYLGYDVGLRFIGSKTSAVIDNVLVTVSSLAPPPVAGPVDHFVISAISSPQTVGTPVSGITITAQDTANNTATSFTGTVTFGGTAGITGTSANFVGGVLSISAGDNLIPTSVGNSLTFTVNDGATPTPHIGSATFNVQSAYDEWAGGPAFNLDSNNDGIANGVAWVIGANNTSANAITLLPTLDNTSDANYFIYSYRRSDIAHADPSVTIAVQYGSTLSGWATAVHDGNNVIISETNDGYGLGVDMVEVKIKRTLAVGDKLFCRLHVALTP